MTLPIIFMYSGQGSQYYQMGRSLFDENKIFKDALLKADQHYQELTGSSVLKHLYNDQQSKSQPFTQTTLTHPAIFMIEYALTQVLFERGIIPDMVLGVSMGEFAAAVTAGAISFESALSAVVKQAQTFEDYTPAGGMLAILHDPNLYKSQDYLYQNSELAAINFASHFVVAGQNENLALITKKLNESNITFQLLPVSHGFHSSLVDGAQVPFLKAIETLPITEIRIPFLSCAQAGLLNSLTPIHFWEIVRQPILFQSSIQHHENQQPAIYVDVGPSGTLATFVKYNLSPTSKSSQFVILTPFGKEIDNLEKVTELLKHR